MPDTEEQLEHLRKCYDTVFRNDEMGYRGQGGKQSNTTGTTTIAIAIASTAVLLLLAFVLYDCHRGGPVYMAMRARIPAAAATLALASPSTQQDGSEGATPAAEPSSLELHFGDHLEGDLAPGSRAAEAFKKFEEDTRAAKRMARRDSPEQERAAQDASAAELAAGFEKITAPARDQEAEKQLEKWKAHCNKRPSRGDMERESFVEQKGHTSLGCDINCHILAALRGGEQEEKPHSSSTFTCFQDSSFRPMYNTETPPTGVLSESEQFPIQNQADPSGALVEDITKGRGRFFNEAR